jgi:hypothetical protein
MNGNDWAPLNYTGYMDESIKQILKDVDFRHLNHAICRITEGRISLEPCVYSWISKEKREEIMAVVIYLVLNNLYYLLVKKDEEKEKKEGTTEKKEEATENKKDEV